MTNAIQCKNIFFVTLLIILAVSSTVFAADGGKKPVWKKNIKPGDCKSCHGNNIKLPDGHPDTKDMQLADCKQCHTRGGKQLETKLLLSHFHSLAGIECSSCHAAKKSRQKTDFSKCISCHGEYEKLAEATKDADPNPHKSHQGKLDCNLCHHQHIKSVNYCGQCHSWPLDVP